EVHVAGEGLAERRPGVDEREGALAELVAGGGLARPVGEARVLVGHDEDARREGNEREQEDGAEELHVFRGPSPPTTSLWNARTAAAKSRRLIAATPAPRSRATRVARGRSAMPNAPVRGSAGRARTRSRPWLRVAVTVTPAKRRSAGRERGASRASTATRGTMYRWGTCVGSTKKAKSA